jgi:hypothetical protein
MSRTLQVFIVAVQVTVIILFSTVSLPGFTQAQPGMLAVLADTMGSSFFHFFFFFLMSVHGWWSYVSNSLVQGF